jgi:hypothetical protein
MTSNELGLIWANNVHLQSSIELSESLIISNIMIKSYYKYTK